MQSTGQTSMHASQPVQAMSILDKNPNVEKTSLFGTSVHAVLKYESLDPSVLAQALRAEGVEVSSIGRVTPSLEDVFLDVVERVGAA